MIDAFRESHKVNLLRPIGKEWDVVLIEVGLSQNGKFYSDILLKKSAPLFEGVKAYACELGNKFDHVPPETLQQVPGGFARNVVGWFSNVRFDSFKRPDGSKGSGVLGKFNVLEGAKWLRDNMKDAWNRGKTDLLGLSISAEGSGKPGTINGQEVVIVESIEFVDSTDIVTNPAAGGSFLRLVASKQEDGVNELLKLIRECRPSWLEGFAEPDDDKELELYALRVLESNLVKAQEEEQEIPSDHIQKLAETARGVKTLNNVISLIRKEKIQEATEMIRNWIGVHQEANNANVGKYSFPYKMYAEKKYKIAESEPEVAAEAGHKDEEDQNTKHNKVADFLVALMRRKGMSASDIAKAIGMTEEDVVTALKSDDPKNSTLAKMAKAMGVSEEDIKKLLPEAAVEAVDGATTEEEVMDDKKLEGLEERERAVATKETALRVREKVLASSLAEPAQNRVIQMFNEKTEVSDEDIEKGIEAELEYITSLTATESGEPTGLGNAHDDGKTDVKIGDGKREKMFKAVEGMIENEDIDGIPKFTSMREAWGAITGKWASPHQITDWIFESIAHGLPHRMNMEVDTYHDYLKGQWKHLASKNLQEAVTTSDFSVAFGDAMFKRLQKAYKDDDLNDWRRVISSIENLPDATNTFRIIRVGQVGTLPTVAQNAAYQELSPVTATEREETMTPSKKGGLRKFTWEDALADRIGVLRDIPTGLGRAAARTIQQAVWDAIEQNTVLNADSVALIDDATHSNRLSGDGALSYANAVILVNQLRDQTELNSGEKLGLDPKFLLVGNTLEDTAVEITDSNVKVTAAEDSTVASVVKRWGIQTFRTNGLGRTSGTENRWYIMIDPKQGETITVGFLGGRDRPEIFVQGKDTPTAGAFFEADSITFKIRLVFATTAVDFRWIQGSLTA